MERFWGETLKHGLYREVQTYDHGGWWNIYRTSMKFEILIAHGDFDTKLWLWVSHKQLYHGAMSMSSDHWLTYHT